MQVSATLAKHTKRSEGAAHGAPVLPQRIERIIVIDCSGSEFQRKTQKNGAKMNETIIQSGERASGPHRLFRRTERRNSIQLGRRLTHKKPFASLGIGIVPHCFIMKISSSPAWRRERACMYFQARCVPVFVPHLPQKDRALFSPPPRRIQTSRPCEAYPRKGGRLPESLTNRIFVLQFIHNQILLF